jgi:hypothetical protein
VRGSKILSILQTQAFMTIKRSPNLRFLAANTQNGFDEWQKIADIG